MSLTIAQITDTHFFATSTGELYGCRTHDSLSKILARLQQLQPQPDMILLTGDLSQDETPASYQNLQALLEPLAIPIYWLPGNHDRPELMREILHQPPFSRKQSIQAGNWRLLLLNSAVPGKISGYLSPESLQWLETQLSQTSNPCLIALHHPPFEVNSRWLDFHKLQNAPDLFNLLARYAQVKLVIFGHIHQEFDIVHQDISYFGTPSSCVQFKPYSPEFALDNTAPGFRFIQLNPDGSFETRVERLTSLKRNIF